jgi:hypothetical protein
MTKLENWSIDTSILQPTNQEARLSISLTGDVYGHPSRPDGQQITTSPVVSVEGKVATTHSGSRYLLGEASEQYTEFCRLNNLPLPVGENPIPLEGAKDG